MSSNPSYKKLDDNVEYAKDVKLKVNQLDAKNNPNHYLYDCGHCGLINMFRPKDLIRCSACGCRVMYKRRTKRMVQYEAR